MSKKFAVFDIDGTLVRWQMFHAIVHGLGKIGAIDPITHNKVREARMDWKNRNTSDSFKKYEKLLVEEYLQVVSNIEYSSYHKVVEDVFNEYKVQLFVYSRELLKDLKDKGYFIIAISGSHDEIIKMLGKYHGFDECVGAVLKVKNGKFTGEIQTPVTGKDRILREIVRSNDLTYKESYGIGDTEGDLPILRMVKNPIAFNPSKELYRHAQVNNWPVVIERKNVIYKLHTQSGSYTTE